VFSTMTHKQGDGDGEDAVLNASTRLLFNELWL
jgi:hypothetical protein